MENDSQNLEDILDFLETKVPDEYFFEYENLKYSHDEIVKLMIKNEGIGKIFNTIMRKNIREIKKKFKSKKEKVISKKKCRAVLVELWKNHPESKIIVFSLKGHTREVVRIVRSGADDYLTLPINKDELTLVTEKLEKLTLKEAQTDYLQGHFWDESSLMASARVSLPFCGGKVLILNGFVVSPLANIET